MSRLVWLLVLLLRVVVCSLLMVLLLRRTRRLQRKRVPPGLPMRSSLLWKVVVHLRSPRVEHSPRLRSIPVSVMLLALLVLLMNVRDTRVEIRVQRPVVVVVVVGMIIDINGIVVVRVRA